MKRIVQTFLDRKFQGGKTWSKGNGKKQICLKSISNSWQESWLLQG